MGRPFVAVLLAGRLRPSALRESMDVPVLCLPMGGQGTLLDAWMDSLATIDGLSGVRIVVNTETDVQAMLSRTGRTDRGEDDGRSISVIAEPASWRGAGGILRDVTGDISDDTVVIVGEAGMIPPPTFSPLLEVMNDSTSAGAVGVYGSDVPDGV